MQVIDDLPVGVTFLSATPAPSSLIDGNDPVFDLGTLAPGASVTITIDDQGPGIPEADLERVFAPFTRLDEARGADTGGMGLGLAIARTILRAHGGEVTLENMAEGGLRAVVRLPRPA